MYFKDLIGFIRCCTNGAISHLEDRKELSGAIQNRRLLRAEDSGTRKVKLAKSGLVVATSLSVMRWQGSITQMTSLVLTR